MNFKVQKLVLTLSISAAIFSCSSDDDSPSASPSNVSKAEVTSNYANIVLQSYTDSYNGALNLKASIDAFVANPDEAGFSASKTAWLNAREAYGQTEAFRETNSPVDIVNNANSPWGINNEGQMNAWPIDESYIDYVQTGTEEYAGTFNSIIGDAAITIDESTIANLNEDATDKSISSGWHAIEFLLWGQDNTMPEENLPGQRAFTDYTTADNANRRAQYLQVATNLLVSDLQALVSTWSQGGTYRTVFMNLDEDVALQQLINGAFFIAGNELSIERMEVPVNSTEGIGNSGQEDEHSCFSDNTNRDVFANAKGAYNVIFGEYASIDGASFYDLVNEANPTQAAALLDAGNEAMAKVNVVGDNAQPFDYLITQETSIDTNFGPVMQAVTALKNFANVISASASTININLQ